MNRLRILAAVGVSAAVVGCGPVAPPHGATQVRFTILTKHSGLLTPIFAGLTADDLVLQEMGFRGQAAAECTYAKEMMCLPPLTIPSGSLLVGLQPFPCADNHLDTAYLEGKALTFVISWNNECPPGARAVAVPEDWVVAVPLSSLPQIRLPLKLDYFNAGSQYAAGQALVDLRAPGPGHARSGNFSLDATPVVAKGQTDHIVLTIFQALDGMIDIAAVDSAGRVVWHTAPFDDPTTFTCLVRRSNSCAVGAYSVEMPTSNVAAGRYTIRPTFIYPAGNIVLPQPTPALPRLTLPTLGIDVTA